MAPDSFRQERGSYPGLLCAGTATAVLLVDRFAGPEVTLGQAALAVAMPPACTWRLLGEDQAPWAVLSIWVCTLLSAYDLSCEVRLGSEPLAAVRPEFWLPAVLLGSLAAATLPAAWAVTRLRVQLPARSFVPWGALLQFLVLLQIGGPTMRPALGLAIGRIDGWPLALTGLCALATTLALAVWSFWWVRGEHGAIQKTLASLLTPSLVVPVAFLNALGEELEFRVLLLGGMLAGPAAEARLWVILAVMLHASYFATLHVKGGFPSGLSGGLLVFVWAVFLGLLRWWTEGMALALLLHTQADVVVFLLVLIAEKRSPSSRRSGKRSA